MHCPFDPSLPSFYPCSTILLDDDESFLLSLRKRLSRVWPTHAFISPSLALKKVHELQETAAKAFDLLSAYDSFPENVDQGDEIVLVNSSRIREFIAASNRYEMASVIVVDQVMPQINGLEFCAQLKGTGIKKIMLTGQMNDSETIEAFNNGLIDRFVSKNDPDVMDKLTQMLNELHQEYLEDQLEPTIKALSATGSHFLENFTVKTILEQVHKEFPYSEYHYVPYPRGYLLANEAGECRFCLLAKDQEQQEIINELLELFEDDETKQDIVSRLNSGSVMLWELFDQFEDAKLWEDKLDSLIFPCQLDDGIRWTLISDDDMPNRIAIEPSWKDFLQQMREPIVNPQD